MPVSACKDANITITSFVAKFSYVIADHKNASDIKHYKICATPLAAASVTLCDNNRGNILFGTLAKLIDFMCGNLCKFINERSFLVRIIDLLLIYGMNTP